MSAHEPDASAVAVIIGREGSKGLPGKNTLLVGGLPMVAHSVHHALMAQRIDQVICSTDGRDIANAAEDAGATVVMRPAQLASDTATVDSAVRHALEATTSRHEYVVILYANVPRRPEGLIDRAVERLEETGACSVQSYAPVGKHHPYWTMRMDAEGRVSEWEENAVFRRQDLPAAHVPDGGVIAVTRESLFQVESGHPHAFLGTDRRGIENPRGAVIDVDDLIDLHVAEAMFQAQTTAGDCR